MNLLNQNFLNKMQNIHLHLKALYKPYQNHQGALPFLSSGFEENPRDMRFSYNPENRSKFLLPAPQPQVWDADYAPVLTCWIHFPRPCISGDETILQFFDSLGILFTAV